MPPRADWQTVTRRLESLDAMKGNDVATKHLTTPKAGIGIGIFFIAVGALAIFLGGTSESISGMGALGLPKWTVSIPLFAIGLLFIVLAVRQTRS
jgi:hypothetical protein